jgi:probable HAF family extracellular repeat protein
MARYILFVGLASLLTGCTERREPGYEFTALTFPEASETVAAGINDAGHIVGWYRQGDVTYGFLYADGKYTSVQYPDASLTQLVGINANGDVSGGYRRTGESQKFEGMELAFHGFVRTKAGEFLEARHPAHKYSMAQRILADGSIVGCYHDDDIASMRGFMVPRHAMTSSTVHESDITVIDAPASMHNGAAPDGSTFVGLLMDTSQAYVVDGDGMRMFTVPGAKHTEAWDINSAGVIVGMFEDVESVSHGYVLENGAFTTMDFPGARGTMAFGINTRGDIVGGIRGAGGERRGFIARRK